MKNKIIRSISLICIISLIFSNSLCVVLAEGPVHEINDFSNFSNYFDSALVTSEQNDEQITMIHDNENNGTTWETYYYNFGELGNYSDFNVEIEIDYSYTGSMLMQAGVRLGSNFFENGTYAGTDSFGTICACGIWDAWAGTAGRYYINVRPYGIIKQYESESGSLTTQGKVKYHFSRTSGSVRVKITKEGVNQFNITWKEGLTRPLNYIYLVLSIDPSYCTYTSVVFTSISAILWESNRSILFGPSTYLVGLFVIVNLTVIYIYRRRKY